MTVDPLRQAAPRDQSEHDELERADQEGSRG